MDLISKRHLFNRICKDKGSSKSRPGPESPNQNRRRMSAESSLLMPPTQSVIGDQENNGKNIQTEVETPSVVIDMDC